ncbi:MAG: hypothetical protein AB1529_01910 [Candidatus Micrarchaeota archaeon]
MTGPAQRNPAEDQRMQQAPRRADQYRQLFENLRSGSPQERLGAIKALSTYIDRNTRPLPFDDRFFPVLRQQRTLGSEIDVRFFPVLLYQRINQIRGVFAGLSHTDPDPQVRKAAESALRQLDALLNRPQNTSPGSQR